jgi:hypothetical protein
MSSSLSPGLIPSALDARTQAFLVLTAAKPKIGGRSRIQQRYRRIAVPRFDYCRRRTVWFGTGCLRSFGRPGYAGNRDRRSWRAGWIQLED